MNRFLSLLSIIFLLKTMPLGAQSAPKDHDDAWQIRAIYDKALTEGQCYPWLTYLTTRIGARISGSPQAAAAVEYTRQVLDSLGVDSVWLQPCMVPHWVRGDKEMVRIVSSSMGDVDLTCLALGNSVGTGPAGIKAPVVEVKSLEEVERLGRKGVEGKIVFFNRAFDATQLSTFAAYGGAVDQRGSGASVAAKYGAVAVLVRSMTPRLDDVPHSGGVVYAKNEKQIPAVAISTQAAELLSSLLRDEPVGVYLRTTCRMLKEQPSYNVIGELRGSEKPNEVIVVGGHLDSWDVGQGAHDDGAGCVQSMDVLNVLRRAGYKPRRTIRCVLFMNEENGLMGGKTYGEYAKNSRETHVAAIESDAGGFTPRGFECDAVEEIFVPKFKKILEWEALLEPYGLYIKKGGGGADISPLKNQKVFLIGFRPDSQRYFDYHHTPADTIDTVNKRELELGTAAMSSLIFLLDKYGL